MFGRNTLLHVDWKIEDNLPISDKSLTVSCATQYTKISRQVNKSKWCLKWKTDFKG